MAGLVDHEALLIDLRSELLQRSSWGQPQLLQLLAELEQRHRIDESEDRRLLRRFAGHLTDTFFGLMPAPTATGSPLAKAAPDGTAKAMEPGARSDPQHGEHPWPPPTPTTPPPPSRPTAAACRSASD